MEVFSAEVAALYDGIVSKLSLFTGRTNTILGMKDYMEHHFGPAMENWASAVNEIGHNHPEIDRAEKMAVITEYHNRLLSNFGSIKPRIAETH